jgi:hypothetical protein
LWLFKEDLLDADLLSNMDFNHRLLMPELQAAGFLAFRVSETRGPARERAKVCVSVKC